MIQKRSYKILLSVILIISLVSVQSMTTYAASVPGITAQQLETLLEGMESIVIQMKELGLNEEDIQALFSLSPKEEDFYTTSKVQTIPYTGEFAVSLDSEDAEELDSLALNSYDGNPPTSMSDQRARVANIYSVALRYYNTNFYEGPKAENKDFGKYLAYLYISHYIDGPGRAPTANDLPYILSSADVTAYNSFINSARLSNWYIAFGNMASALYSIKSDITDEINSINTVDQICKESRNKVKVLSDAFDAKSLFDATKTLSPLIVECMVDNYDNISQEAELTEEIRQYVDNYLSATDFYDEFDKNVTKALEDILISTFFSVILNSISIMGAIVTVVPLFVYEFTGLVQTAVLVNLQYSFSGRLGVRTGIYIGL